LFACQELSDDRFEAIARIAGLDRDLYLFPHGWDTIVGEKGVTLSGGQKQRIALARALAIDPLILLLDDALSAVDAETEERILTALLEERKEKTTIVVSHRISTLRNANRIIVLDSGEVIQQGTHEELMADLEGFYARIAALQQLEQQPEIGPPSRIVENEVFAPGASFLMGLFMDDYFDSEPVTKDYDAQIARRILSYLSPYKRYAVIALIALALSTVGELFSPTIIRRAIDEAIVRDWYGIAPSAINVLSSNSTDAIEIDDRIYVRSSQLSSISVKERDQLVAQGSIDAEPSYVFSLDPDRDKKLAILQEFPETKYSDTYGIIPSSILKNLTG